MGPQYSVGVVEGLPFTACTSGSDIIILASNFTRVQKLTCPSAISSIDCSTDVGKVAASYEHKMIIFEPQPLQSSPTKSEYNWIQTATLDSPEPITVISFNLDGSRVVTGGQTLQLWVINVATSCWQRVWSCQTATSIIYLKYSPDGSLFCSAGKSDRLVKIWHEIDSNFKFSFVYAVHPLPVTGLEWRRTSKYCPKGAVANVLLTSCKDNISRVWVQTLLQPPTQQPNQINWYSKPSLHLGGVIESNLDSSASSNTIQHECEPTAQQFVAHWVNNKEILINRSIEILLHDMLVRILKGNNIQTSSTNSPLSAGKSCSGSENDTDDLNDANDDTITAESSKKLRHKLCRKMNKQRALAASGRQDLASSNNTNADENSNHSNRTSLYSNNGINGRSSPTSLVKEFDKTLELLLKKWQVSTDLIMSVNKSDGSLTMWEVKYLDGEDVGVYRQAQIERLCCVESALPHYDATTMSLNITAYSPSAYLEVKRAYLAVTGASNAGLNKGDNLSISEQFSPSDVLEILSLNNDSGKGDTSSSNQPKDSVSSIIDSEPSIFIVTQHLSGILGLWKLNFEMFPSLQSVDLVTRITGLPIDPSWLNDGILTVEFDEIESALIAKWRPEDFQPKQNQVEKSKQQQLESQDMNEDVDSYRASELANSIIILPQYHTKQLIELLAFGKLQRVKAILNHLVSCLVSMDSNHSVDAEATSPAPWAHRSRTLSIVAQSPPSFHNSFDLDNPANTIQQQVVEEIELDYVEVTSIRPLSLYSLLDADEEKSTGNDSRASTREEFVSSYDSYMDSRFQVDETLDEILGKTAVDKLNEHKELQRLASNATTKGSLTSFNQKRAKLLTKALTHTHLPGLTNVDQMHLLAVADAVALFDASPEDLHNADDDDGSQSNPGMISTNIAIDSLDDRGLRFLTAVRQHIYLTRCLPMKQRNELKAAGIGSHNFIWAFHSETQDELISLIPCVQRGKPEWSELREFGIGWWVKKLEVVKKLIEKVAQSAYQTKQEPLDAALFYLAMKKKTLVCALLRRVSGADKRLLKLFEQDFSDPVNRKKALKNAYALLGKHRFEHAAAFFILAGSIWDAVEVCINNLNDIQLAIILIRLHDSDTNLPDNLKRLLFTEILGSTRPAHKDAFLRSIAHWKLGDYLAATNTLLENDISETRASVFNFYLYLKDQPLVKNRVIEAAERELELCFSTASAYLESGCPLLALEVLSRLDTSRAMRMKFKASSLVIMNELNTLAPGTNDRSQFFEWFKSSMRALNKICSYRLDEDLNLDSKENLETTEKEQHHPETSLDGSGLLKNDSRQPTLDEQQSQEQTNDTAQVAWIEMNEPILRTMLTYCNLHSATENSLTKVRLELLGLLNKLKNKG